MSRKTSLEYINHVIKLGDTLLGLISEALGLKLNHLKATECDQGQTLIYRSCFHYFNIRLVGSNQWVVDVEPIEHGLVVNIGDLLQNIFRKMFSFIPNTPVVKNVGPRILVAYFFSFVSPKMFGPIKELISEENPEFQVAKFFSKPFDKTDTLDLFRL
ncbi:hypothetical protein MTR67_045324 [Solanum verrucosum]|uniref:Uncharacterized protein n=1 Tax=Solanum verrucosum TaxID=315347 RepID=A0AAF0UUC7_SOLVR|nr:hypothetical protein MTR67_045324 [Solanum verrucosum]